MGNNILRRGTTPIHRFTLPDELRGIVLTALYVTYSQGGKVTMEKTTVSYTHLYGSFFYIVLHTASFLPGCGKDGRPTGSRPDGKASGQVGPKSTVPHGRAPSYPYAGQAGPP